MMKLTFALFTVCLAQCVTGLPTWPSAVDELEDIMYLQSGYRSRGMSSRVTPCGYSAAGSGRNAAAEWMRTAFHDAATANTYFGTGGLDASIMFETARLENIGAAFNTTMLDMAAFYSSRASASDLLALSMYVAVRACGGPTVQIKAGRIDATVAGNSGVPDPSDKLGAFQNEFARMGFNSTEMIAITACGHTVGGVHAANFPLIVPVGSAPPNDYKLQDSTGTVFDNKIVTEYVSGHSVDPMVVGPAVAASRASDLVVFQSDNNVTMNSLTDPTFFSSYCGILLQRMIEVVPAGVQLTDPIQPYDVKPNALQLTLLAGGATMSFTGEIRVRTTIISAAQIASVQVIYKDRTGGSTCGNCTISTAAAGTASGYDDSFTFYTFSSAVSTTTSISSFTVLVTLTSGATQIYNNNGAGYPVQDTIMFQSPQSCLAANTLNVVAAVRTTAYPVTLSLSLKVPRNGAVVPALTNTSVAMTQLGSAGPYTLYTASYTLTAAQSTDTHFDVVSGSGTSKLADTFKYTANLAGTCGTLPVGSSSSSSSSSIVTSTSSIPPSSSSTTSTASSTPTLLCPGSDGAIFTAGRSTYKIECFIDHQAGDLSMAYTSSLNDCITACESTVGCVDVSWIPGSPGPCYMKSAVGGAVSNTGVWGALKQANTASATTSSSSVSVISTSTTIISSSSSLPSSSSSSSTSSSTPPAASGWQAVGCYTDNVSARTLTVGVGVSGGSANMTNENCQTSCSASGYTLAGTEYSGECYCGNKLLNGGGPAPDGNVGCNMACYGNSAEICGGPNRLSLFSFGPLAGSSSSSSTTIPLKTTTVSSTASSTTSSTSNAASSSTSPAIPGFPGWSYTGCYADNVSARTLSVGMAVPGGAAAMTIELCLAACQNAGYILAGLEYSQECYCDNTIRYGTGPSPNANTLCVMTCNGNSKEICGGSNGLSLYSFSAGSSSSTKSSASSTLVTSTVPTTSKTTTSSSSATTTAVQSGPAIKATLGAYSYYGCVTDKTTDRTLSLASAASDSMDLETCQSFCSGNLYFGVEYARECYCGNSLVSTSTMAPNTDCSYTCAGNSLEYCGAGNRLSVYTMNNTSTAISSTSSVPAATPTPGVNKATVGKYKSYACVSDSVAARTLTGNAATSDSMSLESCAAVCSGYTYFGTEYGQECYCGNSFANGGANTTSTDCNMLCAGNTQEFCGAGNRLSVYVLGS